MPLMSFETARLRIRPFHPADLDAIHLLPQRCFGQDGVSRDERRSWLTWSELSQEWLPKMHQVIWR